MSPAFPNAPTSNFMQVIEMFNPSGQADSLFVEIRHISTVQKYVRSYHPATIATHGKSA